MARDLQLPPDVATDQGVANLDQGQASRKEKDGRSKADPEQAFASSESIGSVPA